MDLDLGGTNVFAQGQIFFDYFVDTEHLHFVNVTGQDGFQQVNGVDVHRKHFFVVAAQYKRTFATVEVGVHRVLFFGSEPREIRAGETEFLAAEGFCPTEHFVVVSFGNQGYLVVKEAQESVCSYVGTRQDVATDEAYGAAGLETFCIRGGLVSDGLHGHTNNGFYVSGFVCTGTGHGHQLREVASSVQEQTADEDQLVQTNGPNHFSFLDGSDVVDLDTDVTTRVGT